MQDDKKSKKDIIEKLRMILDNPHIKDDSIKNKDLIHLQNKLSEPSALNSISSNKGVEQTDEDDPLKASVTIHRKQKIPTFIEEKDDNKNVVFTEIEEDLFKDEELYEIEKIEDDIEEFTEIKDEDDTFKEVIKDQDIEKEQDLEQSDNLPEWKTVDSEILDSETKKEEKESLKNIPEWEPITNEQFKDKPSKIKQKKIKKDEYVEESDIKFENINIFSQIKSIDDNIAELLYNNGYESLDDLRDITIKDLTKIKGIKRKIAKKIKKDIKDFFENQDTPEFESIDEEVSDDDFENTKFTDEKRDKNGIINQKNGVFCYGKYTLYRKEIKLQSDKKRIIHFFSKEKPDDGEKVDLPEGYEVKVNKKTGVPYISRKK